jgi:NAD(P)-dependent dehydrogenase (short-subunit alcohol dehydrogenase family)
MIHTHQTAPPQFVEAAGIRFGYRRFGVAIDIPLLFFMHFTGTMDHWDPASTDGFAQDREVILFNNAGVSRSSGEVPTSIEEMAQHAAALGIKKMNTHNILTFYGALTGIGRAIALTYAREGARVVVSGRRDEEGHKLGAGIHELGAEAEFQRCDVRHDEDVRDLVDKTVARFGRLDVAINCAGTEGIPGPLTDQTAETYAATFDTNVLGTLLSMKHEMRVMLAQGSGSIVNVSSTYGHIGAAGASYTRRASMQSKDSPSRPHSKPLRLGYALTWSPPGPIENWLLNRLTGTDEEKAAVAAKVPLKRVGRPEEIAQTIMFLASDKASFITGASYLVDGQDGPVTHQYPAHFAHSVTNFLNG